MTDEKKISNPMVERIWEILAEYTMTVDASVAKILESRRKCCRQLDALCGIPDPTDNLKTKELLDELSRKIGEIE